MDKKSILETAKKDGLELVDVKFADLLGTWQHFTVTLESLNFDGTDRLPFDGSSIRGFQEIHESDMELIPDLDTVFIDPYSKKSVSVSCDIYDPIKKEFYTRDPRYIAKKAEKRLKESGIADTAYFGPEAEFFIFDSVRYDQNEHSGYYFVDSSEGIWNSGKIEEGGNLGYKPRH
ncbi:Glutamine synthetase [uncultured archaeon]|nr:Glutamine synthetase [uncultured archaeon]